MKEEILQPNEVISTESTDHKFIKGLKTFTVREAIIALQETGFGNQLKSWLEEGVPCKVLTPKHDWRTGKVKINLTFYPDEVEPDVKTASEASEDVIEYPLDEIRRSLNSDEIP